MWLLKTIFNQRHYLRKDETENETIAGEKQETLTSLMNESFSSFIECQRFCIICQLIE